MGIVAAPTAVYWVDEPASIDIIDGICACRIRTGETTIELRGTFETTLKSYANVRSAIDRFEREQGRLAVAAELKVIPLCELCVRHDLPKHTDDPH